MFETYSKKSRDFFWLIFKYHCSFLFKSLPEKVSRSRYLITKHLPSKIWTRELDCQQKWESRTLAVVAGEQQSKKVKRFRRAATD